MPRHIRSLIALLFVAAGACSSADQSVTPRLSPAASKPVASRIKATDSLMIETDILYGDTAQMLQRISPLTSDITATALIGTSGGSLRIDAAGVTVEVPRNALAAPTQITVRALKGGGVAYEFEPHGTLFRKPVMIEQDLTVTAAATNTALLKGMHGSYFPVSLDSSWVDAARLTVKVKEHQLGYKEVGGGRVRFYVDHFSGYLVSLGAF